MSNITLPERIWLQHDPENTGEPFDDAEGVTWCKDKINDTDAEYILASVAAERCAGMRDELKKANTIIFKLETLIKYYGYPEEMPELRFEERHAALAEEEK